MTRLTKYTKRVNDLARKDAAKLDGFFKAVHHDFPESMTAWYLHNGYTPRQLLTQLNEDAEAENAAEARCS